MYAGMRHLHGVPVHCRARRARRGDGQAYGHHAPDGKRGAEGSAPTTVADPAWWQPDRHHRPAWPGGCRGEADDPDVRTSPRPRRRPVPAAWRRRPPPTGRDGSTTARLAGAGPAVSGVWLRSATVRSSRLESSLFPTVNGWPTACRPVAGHAAGDHVSRPAPPWPRGDAAGGRRRQRPRCSRVGAWLCQGRRAGAPSAAARRRAARELEGEPGTSPAVGGPARHRWSPCCPGMAAAALPARCRGRRGPHARRCHLPLDAVGAGPDHLRRRRPADLGVARPHADPPPCPSRRRPTAGAGQGPTGRRAPPGT